MQEESELLEYETEQEDEPQEISPIPVHVCEPVVTVATVPQHVSTYTVVVAVGDSTNGILQLMPQDPLRVRAVITCNDQAVVICHSLPQAMSTANQAASVPNPSGAYLAAGQTVTINGTQEMFVAATGTVARVSVITERRSA